MSLKFIQQPINYTPVLNEMFYVLSGNTFNNQNYQYIFELFAGENNDLIGQFKYPVRLNSNNTSVFNSQSILKDYLSYDIDSFDIGFLDCPNSYLTNVQILGGEEYYVSGTTVTKFLNQASSNTITIRNNRINNLDFINYNNVIDDLVTKRFLTKYPINENYEIEMDAFKWLYYFTTGQTNTIKNVEIKGYDINNNVISTNNLVNTLTATTTNNIIQRIGVGTKNLRLIISNGTIDQWNYYTLNFKNELNETINLIRFDIDKCETRHKEKYRIHFLNDDGGFDSFTFNKKNIITTDINKNSYSKSKYSYDTINNSYGYKSNQKTNIITSIQTNTEIEVYSNWLSESKYNWLSSQLLSSPVVFLEHNNLLLNINILEKSFIKKTRLNNDMIFLNIKFSVDMFNENRF